MRWIIVIPLVLLVVVAGFLLAAILIPRGTDEPAGPSPTLIVTQTIPALEP